MYGKEWGTSIARNVLQALESRGYAGRVFFDHDEIGPENFEHEILNAIKQSTVFVFVLTKDSLMRCNNEGDWVRREICQAIASNLKIIIINPDNEFNNDYPENFPDELQIIKKLNHIEVRTSAFPRDMDYVTTSYIDPIIKRTKGNYLRKIFSGIRAELDVYKRNILPLCISALVCIPIGAVMIDALTHCDSIDKEFILNKGMNGIRLILGSFTLLLCNHAIAKKGKHQPYLTIATIVFCALLASFLVIEQSFGEYSLYAIIVVIIMYVCWSLYKILYKQYANKCRIYELLMHSILILTIVASTLLPVTVAHFSGFKADLFYYGHDCMDALINKEPIYSYRVACLLQEQQASNNKIDEWYIRSLQKIDIGSNKSPKEYCYIYESYVDFLQSCGQTEKISYYRGIISSLKH
jgi:hypothetical protein